MYIYTYICRPDGMQMNEAPSTHIGANEWQNGGSMRKWLEGRCKRLYVAL